MRIMSTRPRNAETPVAGDKLPAGPVSVLGAAYAGEAAVERVDLSIDNGKSWQAASLMRTFRLTCFISIPPGHKVYNRLLGLESAVHVIVFSCKYQTNKKIVIYFHAK